MDHEYEQMPAGKALDKASSIGGYAAQSRAVTSTLNQQLARLEETISESAKISDEIELRLKGPQQEASAGMADALLSETGADNAMSVLSRAQRKAERARERLQHILSVL